MLVQVNFQQFQRMFEFIDTSFILYVVSAFSCLKKAHCIKISIVLCTLWKFNAMFELFTHVSWDISWFWICLFIAHCHHWSLLCPKLVILPSILIYNLWRSSSLLGTVSYFLVLVLLSKQLKSLLRFTYMASQSIMALPFNSYCFY